MPKRTIFSIGILISFFLPWVDLVFVHVSGYDISMSIDKFANLSAAFNKSSDTGYYKLSYLLYLIPLLAAYNIYKDLVIKDKMSFTTGGEFLIAAMSCALIGCLVSNTNYDAFKILSVGFYSTCLFSVLGFIPFKEHYKFNGEKVINVENATVDNQSIFDKLSQIHTLREKNVITQDLYDHQRMVLLESLNQNPIKEDLSHQKEAEYLEPIVDTEFENLFNKRPWFNRNLKWVIPSLVILVLSSFAIFRTSKPDPLKLVGTWDIQTEMINLLDTTSSGKIFMSKLKKSVSLFTYNFNTDSSFKVRAFTSDGDQMNEGTYHIDPDQKTLVTKFNEFTEEYKIKKINEDSILLIGKHVEYPLSRVVVE